MNPASRLPWAVFPQHEVKIPTDDFVSSLDSLELSGEDFGDYDDPRDVLHSDNSIAAELTRNYHMPPPSGRILARVQIRHGEEYTVREVDSGGIYAYNCEDTRLVIPICKSRDQLPNSKGLKRMIQMRKPHYEA